MPENEKASFAGGQRGHIEDQVVNAAQAWRQVSTAAGAEDGDIWCSPGASQEVCVDMMLDNEHQGVAFVNTAIPAAQRLAGTASASAIYALNPLSSAMPSTLQQKVHRVRAAAVSERYRAAAGATLFRFIRFCNDAKFLYPAVSHPREKCYTCS